MSVFILNTAKFCDNTANICRGFLGNRQNNNNSEKKKKNWLENTTNSWLSQTPSVLQGNANKPIRGAFAAETEI